MRMTAPIIFAALAGVSFLTAGPVAAQAFRQAASQADPNGNMHAISAAQAVRGTTAPSRTGRVISRPHRVTSGHRFVRHFHRRRGLGIVYGFGGYPAYVAGDGESAAIPYAEPGDIGEREAPALIESAPVYAPPTLYPAKYYYSPSPGVYFYRPAFKHDGKCGCG